MPAPVDQPARREFDGFSSISLKYGFLFGLNKESRILLIGEYFQAISHDLAQSYAAVDCMTQPDDLKDVEIGRYDLICLDAYSRWTSCNLPALIRKARSNLSATGTLIVAATNRLSIERILARLRHRVVNHMRGLTPWGYKKALKAAGFFSVYEFIVLPTLREPEEYVDAGQGDVELPGYVSFVHKVFCALGLYRHMHSDYLYVASTLPTSRFVSFAAAIDSYAPATGCSPHAALRLERFDLRNRGALMIMLSDRVKKRHFVVRVAVSEKVNAVIAGNKSFTDRISALDTLDPRIISMVPRSIAAFSYHGCHVYVENRIAGVLVWKVGRDQRIERVAYRDAFEFIRAFNLATRQEAIVDLTLFGELLGNDLAQIKSAFNGVAAIDAIIDDIESRLRTYFIGRRISTVWGHGDYGYGNILCERVTGHVQGVIDWDTHIEKELPGVDLCNLLLQRNGMEFSGDIARAMESLHRKITATGKLDRILPGYDKEDFDLDARDLTIYLCIAGLRMVKRSLPYAQEFSEGKDGYIDILSAAGHILETTISSPRATDNDTRH